MNEIKYYICTYADYTFKRRKTRVIKRRGKVIRTLKGRMLSKRLSNSHSLGHERQSLDGTKFITWDREDAKGLHSLKWMHGNEPEFTHAEILAVLLGADWFDPAEIL